MDAGGPGSPIAGWPSAKNLALAPLHRPGRHHRRPEVGAENVGSHLALSWMAGAALSMGASKSKSTRDPEGRGRDARSTAVPPYRRGKEKAMHDKFSQRIEAALATACRAHRRRQRSALDPAPVNRSDRPPPAAQSARRRSLRDCAASRTAARRAFSLVRCLQRRIRRLGRALGRRLSAALEHRRTGAISSSGRPISNSPRPKPRFASTRISCNVRPIWHQREDRVQAHILVCFLAFVLWKCLEMWQSAPGLETRRVPSSKNWRASSRTTSSLPTATHGEIRLRCVTQPDAAQAALLDRLGIVLPKAHAPR